MLRCGGCVSAIELNHLDPPRLDGFANPILNLSWPPAAHRICGDRRVLFLMHAGHGISRSQRPHNLEGDVSQSSGASPRRENADSHLLFDRLNQNRNRVVIARRTALAMTTRRSPIAQFVGWVERSETHQSRRGRDGGFCFALPTLHSALSPCAGTRSRRRRGRCGSCPSCRMHRRACRPRC